MAFGLGHGFNFPRWPAGGVSAETQAVLDYIAANGGVVSSTEQAAISAFVDIQVAANQWAADLISPYMILLALDDALAARTDWFNGSLATLAGDPATKITEGYQFTGNAEIDTGVTGPQVDSEMFWSVNVGSNAGQTDISSLAEANFRWLTRRAVGGITQFNIASGAVMSDGEVVQPYALYTGHRDGTGTANRNAYRSGLLVDTSSGTFQAPSGNVRINRSTNVNSIIGHYAQASGNIDMAIWNSAMMTLLGATSEGIYREGSIYSGVKAATDGVWITEAQATGVNALRVDDATVVVLLGWGDTPAEASVLKTGVSPGDRLVTPITGNYIGWQAFGADGTLRIEQSVIG